MEQCTFRPSISSRSQLYAQRARAFSAEPLPERLHHEADRRAALREKAKQIVEAEDLIEHTFHPTINKPNTSSGDAHTPIHLRAIAIQKMKQDRVRAAQLEEERRLHGEFKPQISEQSRKMARRRLERLEAACREGGCSGSALRLDGPVEQRLLLEAQLLEQRRALRQDSVVDSLRSGLSVDEGSRRLSAASGNNLEFLERQTEFEAIRQQRRELRARHAEEECTFAPRISATSRHLVATNIDFVQSGPSGATERLAVKDLCKRDQRQKELVKQHSQECTFRPAIDPLSQQLAALAGGGSSSSSSAGAAEVYERLYRAGLESKSRKDSVGEAESEECTFRPQIAPAAAKRFAYVRSRYAGGGSAVMESVRSELDRRGEDLARKRRELEEQEMAECTFNPDAGKPYTEPPGPTLVSGLDRFLELRDMARRQRREMEERLQRVLRPDYSEARCGGITIPTPFDLSGAPLAASQRPRPDAAWPDDASSQGG